MAIILHAHSIMENLLKNVYGHRINIVYFRALQTGVRKKKARKNARLQRQFYQCLQLFKSLIFFIKLDLYMSTISPKVGSGTSRRLARG